MPVGNCSKAKGCLSGGMRYEKCGRIGRRSSRHGGELEGRGLPVIRTAVDETDETDALQHVVQGSLAAAVGGGVVGGGDGGNGGQARGGLVA